MISELRKLRLILEGFKNYTFKSPEIEIIATQRAKKCSDCKEANPKFIFQNFKDGNLSEIEGMGCNPCQCLISAKVRSPLEKCPLGNW